jgi:hypothetical protein
MMRNRYRTAATLGTAVFAAVAFIAVRHPSRTLAVASSIAMWICLLASFPNVFLGPARRRPFLFGFALFGWTYHGLGFTVSTEIPPLLSPRLLDLLNAGWREYPPYFLVMVRSLATLMFGLIGGISAIFVFGKEDRP